MSPEALTRSGPFWLSAALGNTLDIVAAPQLHVEVAISAGVQRIKNTTGNAPAAWIALPPFTPIDACRSLPMTSRDRLGIVQNIADIDWRQHLTLAQMPPALLAAAHDELIPLMAGADGEGNGQLQDAIASFGKRFRAALASQGFAFGPSVSSDVVVNRPDLVSTAFNFDTNSMVGLHIDNHQKLPNAERHTANILANVNIGWSHRHLDFVPHTMSGLLRLLGEDERSTMAPREVKDAVFAAAPDTAVLRITLPPGMAYLLNTQNAIHDGAVPPGDVPDVAFLTMAAPL